MVRSDRPPDDVEGGEDEPLDIIDQPVSLSLAVEGEGGGPVGRLYAIAKYMLLAAHAAERLAESEEWFGGFAEAACAELDSLAEAALDKLAAALSSGPGPKGK